MKPMHRAVSWTERPSMDAASRWPVLVPVRMAYSDAPLLRSLAAA
jgi:hypothetical protein